MKVSSSGRGKGININVLKLMFSYAEGKLFWSKSGGNRPAGSEAGHLCKDTSRWIVKINQRNHRRCRLVWIYHNGLIPERCTIVHKNGDITDDRIENLAIFVSKKSKKKMVEPISVYDKIKLNTGLIGSCYKRYKTPPTWENEDWLSEIKLVYIKACLAHRESKGKLATIVDRMVRNEWSTAISKVKTFKRGWKSKTNSLADLVDSEGIGYEPADYDESYDRVDSVDELKYAVKWLDKREVEMFKMSSDGKSCSEISRKVGLSRSRTSEIMFDARKKVQRRMAESYGE